MSEQNHIYGYSAGDIGRYLTGEMPAAEMRQLEIRALEDPFLQDAIDGYEENFSKNPHQNIQPWLNQIRYIPITEEKKEKAAIIPIWQKKWLQYTVAATLVVGVGWTIFNLSQQNELLIREKSAVKTTKADSGSEIENPVVIVEGVSNEAAKNSSKKENEAIIPENQSSKPEADKKPAIVQKQTEIEQKMEAENMAQPATVITSNDIAIVSQKAEEHTYAKIKEDETIPKLRSATGQLPAAPITSAATTNQLVKKDTQTLESAKLGNRPMMEKKNILVPTSISGQVLNEEKYPLDNIKLKLTGIINQELLSDELGRFYFSLPENTVGLLTVSGNGYKTKKQNVKAGENLEILLQKGDKSLSEMIVEEYSKKSLGIAETARIDTSEAAPVDGWNNFVNYLNNNKIEINKARQKEITVVLSFEVDEKGRPEYIDVIQSGGSLADIDAIRLIKNGPYWRNKTGSLGALVKVVVKY